MPMYHMIKAKAQRKLNQLDDCVKTLQSAMQLPGVKHRVASASKRAGKVRPISTSDRVSVYLELADAYRLTDAQVSCSA